MLLADFVPRPWPTKIGTTILDLALKCCDVTSSSSLTLESLSEALHAIQEPEAKPEDLREKGGEKQKDRSRQKRRSSSRSSKSSKEDTESVSSNGSNGSGGSTSTNTGSGGSNSTATGRRRRRSRSRSSGGSGSFSDEGSSGTTSGDQDQQPSECVICLSAQSDARIDPCGHAVLCFDCALTLLSSSIAPMCPICRAPCTDVSLGAFASDFAPDPSCFPSVSDLTTHVANTLNNATTIFSFWS